MIELEASDYPGFASASLDLWVLRGVTSPSWITDRHPAFDRQVDVFLGEKHLNLTHYEWGICLHGTRDSSACRRKHKGIQGGAQVVLRVRQGRRPRRYHG